MKVKGYYNDILTEFEVEDTPQETEQEQLSDEMKQAIEQYIVDF